MATDLRKTRVKGVPNLLARSWTTNRGERRTRYYVRFRDWKGVDRELPAGDVLKAAKEFRDETMRLNLHRHDFDRVTAKNVTFTNWCTHWLDLQRRKKAYPRYELAARSLTAYYAETSLSALTTSTIEKYIAHRLNQTVRGGKPPAAATINRELQILKSMLILAERDGLLAKRPHLTRLEEHNLRDRTASPEEYRAIYQAMPSHMQPVLVLMRELGMRVSEAVNLTSQQIDWKRRVIVLKAEHTKTKRQRLLPINQVIESALKGVAPGKDGRLFWHSGRPLNRHHLHDYFQVRCRQLGIRGLWVHDLRGTFATDALERGYDRTLVRKLTGHASDAAFDRYVRPKLETLRKIVDRPTRQTMH